MICVGCMPSWLPYGSLVPSLLTGRGSWSFLFLSCYSYLERKKGPARLQQLPWYYAPQCSWRGARPSIADANSQPVTEAAEY